MAEMGKILPQYKQERSNPKDLYAVSVMKGDTIVGHIQFKKSHVVWYFTKPDEVVICQVID